MCHRIREGMRETNPAPLGVEGNVVEADGKRETPAQISRGRVLRDLISIGVPRAGLGVSQGRFEPGRSYSVSAV